MLTAVSFNENNIASSKYFYGFIIYFAYSSSYVVSYSESCQRSKWSSLGKQVMTKIC